MNTDPASQAGPVREAHHVDLAPLTSWLESNIEGFQGPVDVTQFKGGQSNPTYLLATPGQRYVMRKKPPGRLLKSAHQVDREYRVMSALADTDVPVPRMYALCTDAEVIGTDFYIMECLEGRIFRDPRLPQLSPTERTAVYESMGEVLAALHNVDTTAVGLDDYGRQGNYFDRQLGRWSGQYRDSQTEQLPDMDTLIDWLPANIPDDDSSCIAHGDYRLENSVYHPDQERMIAVLDWELSTLGHPLADLAYNCMGYHVQSPTQSGLVDVDFAATGIPTEDQYVASYCRRTGRDGIDNWNYYVAFSLFRMAAITQGVYKRGLDGNASSELATSYGEVCRYLATRACELLELG